MRQQSRQQIIPSQTGGDGISPELLAKIGKIPRIPVTREVMFDGSQLPIMQEMNYQSNNNVNVLPGRRGFYTLVAFVPDSLVGFFNYNYNEDWEIDQIMEWIKEDPSYHDGVIMLPVANMLRLVEDDGELVIHDLAFSSEARSSSKYPLTNQIPILVDPIDINSISVLVDGRKAGDIGRARSNGDHVWGRSNSTGYDLYRRSFQAQIGVDGTTFTKVSGDDLSAHYDIGRPVLLGGSHNATITDINGTVVTITPAYPSLGWGSTVAGLIHITSPLSPFGYTMIKHESPFNGLRNYPGAGSVSFRNRSYAIDSEVTNPVYTGHPQGESVARDMLISRENAYSDYYIVDAWFSRKPGTTLGQILDVSGETANDALKGKAIIWARVDRDSHPTDMGLKSYRHSDPVTIRINKLSNTVITRQVGEREVFRPGFSVYPSIAKYPTGDDPTDSAVSPFVRTGSDNVFAGTIMGKMIIGGTVYRVSLVVNQSTINLDPATPYTASIPAEGIDAKFVFDDFVCLTWNEPFSSLGSHVGFYECDRDTASPTTSVQDSGSSTITGDIWPVTPTYSCTVTMTQETTTITRSSGDNFNKSMEDWVLEINGTVRFHHIWSVTNNNSLTTYDVIPTAASVSPLPGGTISSPVNATVRYVSPLKSLDVPSCSMLFTPSMNSYPHMDADERYDMFPVQRGGRFHHRELWAWSNTLVKDPASAYGPTDFDHEKWPAGMMDIMLVPNTTAALKSKPADLSTMTPGGTSEEKHMVRLRPPQDPTDVGDSNVRYYVVQNRSYFRNQEWTAGAITVPDGGFIKGWSGPSRAMLLGIRRKRVSAESVVTSYELFPYVPSVDDQPISNTQMQLTFTTLLKQGEVMPGDNAEMIDDLDKMTF